jgi:hypothetical protein
VSYENFSEVIDPLLIPYLLTIYFSKLEFGNGEKRKRFHRKPGEKGIRTQTENDKDSEKESKK